MYIPQAATSSWTVNGLSSLFGSSTEERVFPTNMPLETHTLWYWEGALDPAFIDAQPLNLVCRLHNREQ